MKMESLPRPKEHEDRTGPELWIDEAIWGHRLHDEQTPWLTLLEFLGVVRAEHQLGRALTEATPNLLSYRPQQQLRLRNLLFNNPHLNVVRRLIKDDDEKWVEWLRLMKDTAGGLGAEPDFSYLRRHFDNFDDFAAVIDFLHSSAIEGNSNKRWSSKFVFPFGANALYEDLKVTDAGGVSNDRRFFGRTGEILYMMLARSAKAEEVKAKTISRLLAGAGPYDRLVHVLQGTPETSVQERGGSYLPSSSHPAFDRLSEDWLSLLASDVQVYDIIPHLVTMTGLNLILYQLERAKEALEDTSKVSLVWEIVGPKRSKVRELSEQCYQANNLLPGQAVEHYIRSVENTEDWTSACASDDPRASAGEILLKRFMWPSSKELDETLGGPSDLLETLIGNARTRHRQHVAKFHGTWSRLIGMGSRRSSRSTRYAPTDRLLKTLVVCCVDGRQELNEFLATLSERYGIVIGDRQADHLISAGAADQDDFSDNARRLEARLKSLGLLQQLSDSCAYVVNPFERTRA